MEHINNKNIKPNRRFKKIFFRIFSLIFISLFILIAIFIWCSASKKGFAWTISQICNHSNNTLSIKQINGTFWQGFSFKNIQITTSTNKIELDNLKLNWSAKDLLSESLHITKINLGNIKITQYKTIEKPNAPIQIPSSLKLPIYIKIDNLLIESISLNDKYIIYRTSVNYSYTKIKHNLNINNLESIWGKASANFYINDTKPFKLNSQIKIQPNTKDLYARGSGVVNISGDLYKTKIDAIYLGHNLSIKLNSHIDPFANQLLSKLKDINLSTHGINPYNIDNRLPKGYFDLSIFMAPSNKDNLYGKIILNNSEPGKIQAKHLPLKNITADFKLSKNKLSSNNLIVNLINGIINISGTLSNNKISLKAKATQVLLDDFTALPIANQHMSGNLIANSNLKQTQIKLNLKTEKLQAQSELSIEETKKNKIINIKKLNIKASNNGVIQCKGNIDLGKEKQININTKLIDINPKDFIVKMPSGKINASLAIIATLAKNTKIQSDLIFGNSQINGAALSGNIHVNLYNKRISNLQANLQLAQNTLKASGAFGSNNDKITAHIDANNLSPLGSDFSGAINANVVLAGNIQTPLLDASVKINNLRLPSKINIKQMALSAHTGEYINSPLNLIIDAQDIHINSFNANQINFKLTGSRANHQINSQASFNLNNRLYKINLIATGKELTNKAEINWNGKINKMELTGDSEIILKKPLNLQISNKRVNLDSAEFSLLGGYLKIDSFAWQKGNLIITKGRASNISLLALSQLIPNLSGQTLLFNADWNIDTKRKTNNGIININRLSGDLMIPSASGGKIPAKLSKLQAQIKLSTGSSDFKVDLVSQFANIKTQGSFNSINILPDMNSPINASLQAEVPSFAELKPFLPIGLNITGKLNANISIKGSLTNRYMNGTITAKQLSLYDRKTGIKLENGKLNMHLNGQDLIIDQLYFISQENGHTGNVSAKGTVDMQSDIPTANAQVIFDKFSVFSKPGRRLIVSGTSNLGLSSSKGISLQGNLLVNFGRIDLSKSMSPNLSDDVIIVGTTPPEQSSLEKLPINVAMQLDLGDKFSFSAEGLNVTLGGKLMIKAKPGSAPSANGQVNIITGRYKAYGQDLDIKNGSITFNGPLDNPTLNVRAERRLSPVGAGVKVTGSVSQPIVQLVSNESMSDQEILAWLVLGRSANGSQDNNALAIAASSFLAGSINDKIGLFDDFGIQNKQEHYSSDGQVSPAEQVITVGKQLSKNIYVGYEYGISSTNQAVKLIYQLSKIWSFVLRFGQDSSSTEARFTYRFD